MGSSVWWLSGRLASLSDAAEEVSHWGVRDAGGAVVQETHKVKCLTTWSHNKSQDAFCKDESVLLSVLASPR